MSEQYPRGKLNADDEGATFLGIGIQDQTLIFNFSKHVHWFGLDYFEAVAFAEAILAQAKSIKPKGMIEQ